MKPKGPTDSFRPGWIQVLRQQHRESVSIRLFVWLSSAVAVPGALSPWGGLLGAQPGPKTADLSPHWRHTPPRPLPVILTSLGPMLILEPRWDRPPRPTVVQGDGPKGKQGLLSPEEGVQREASGILRSVGASSEPGTPPIRCPGGATLQREGGAESQGHWENSPKEESLTVTLSRCLCFLICKMGVILHFSIHSGSEPCWTTVSAVQHNSLSTFPAPGATAVLPGWAPRAPSLRLPHSPTHLLGGLPLCVLKRKLRPSGA